MCVCVYLYSCIRFVCVGKNRAGEQKTFFFLRKYHWSSLISKRLRKNFLREWNFHKGSPKPIPLLCYPFLCTPQDTTISLRVHSSLWLNTGAFHLWSHPRRDPLCPRETGSLQRINVLFLSSFLLATNQSEVQSNFLFCFLGFYLNPY